MPWFKVDDNLSFHPKVVAAGNAAMGMWVRAGSWSAQHLTEGFVPDSVVATLGGKAQAKALERAGLWARVEGGWSFHQWEERQPTRQAVESERAEARERMRAHRDAKKKANKPPRSEDVRANTSGTCGDGSGSPSPSLLSVTSPSSTTVRAAPPPDDDELVAAVVTARAARLGRHTPTDGWRRAVAAKIDRTEARRLADQGLDPADIDRRLDGVPLDPPRTAIALTRIVNGRACRHVAGTGWVPIPDDFEVGA